jgi:hypothetical protein
MFFQKTILFDVHSEKKDIVLEINAPKYLKDTLKSVNIPIKIKI